jgi:maltokinase
VRVEPTAIERLLPDYLVRQRWFAGDAVDDVSIVELDVLREGPPQLVWALVAAGGVTYQVVIGLRPLDQAEPFLEGKGRGVLGDVDTDDGPMLAYDATFDPDLAPLILALAAPDEHVERVRPLSAEQSNTSVVFDERIVLKLFRRVEIGPNPDVELPGALTAAGFPHVAPTVGEWHRDGRDLAVGRGFLDGGGDGWQLALTSLRDLYASRVVDPGEAGGDIGPESFRLGQVTAELHLALAAAFGASPGEPARWADIMERSLGELDDDEIPRKAFAALRGVGDAGKSVRVHGDLHLGQVMRTDAGWFVIDFEGEPAVPLAERRLPSSPLRDVAGMLRSFHYAAEVARRDQGDAADTEELCALAALWEDHAVSCFLNGYRSVDGVAELLPRSPAAQAIVLDAFVAAKAVYEVHYERAHRPEWVDIPLAALRRLAGSHA